MTLQQIKTMIESMVQSAGLTDYAYYQFEEGSAPNLPYLIFYYPSTNNVGADNIVWAKVNVLNIELYTENKDFSKENTIETVLTEYGFFYNKTEQYIESEKMYEVLYELEVTINEQQD